MKKEKLYVMCTNNWKMIFCLFLLCLHILIDPQCIVLLVCAILSFIQLITFKDINVTTKVWESNINNLYKKDTQSD